MATADTEVYPGQILAGKYRIEQILGKGGMGVVVAATHVQLDERVALKFLLPEALANAEAVRRFEREARAAVKIKSEHVARVTDVGTLDTGSPYMVMEYLNGLDLGQYLERNGVLQPAEAAEYLLQACEAIAEAHSLGIIHRDLKPANLFRIMRADGTPSIKVLDFGISKVMAEAAMTQTSSMMGSPYYMSPEQMTSSRSVDPRTDVWALGVIFHELLTGRVPFEGETIPEICVQILQAPPPSLSKVRPELPAELDQIIDRALAKDRGKRYPDVAAFARDLAQFAPKTGRLSAERISRVLGVSNTVAAGGLADGAHAPVRAAPRSLADPVARTLAGAAHTQPDAGPKKRSALAQALALLGVVVAVGLGVLFLLARLRGGTGAEVTAAAQQPPGEPAPSVEAPEAHLARELAAPSALAEPVPAEPVSATTSTGAAPGAPDDPAEETGPAIASPRQAAPAPRPTSRPSVQPSTPVRSPTPRSSSQPAPASAAPVAPAGSPRDLFLDRK